MLLDLRGIIELPGGKVTFDYEPDMSAAIGGSIARFKDRVRAVGKVTNNAGLLTFTCNIEAICVCTCARCLKEFELPVSKTITANITEDGIGSDPDGYRIQGNEIDITEIITTEFILNTDDKLLCQGDCAGICQTCGTDLNENPCACKKEVDPRLAVLGQLLEVIDN